MAALGAGGAVAHRNSLRLLLDPPQQQRGSSSGCCWSSLSSSASAKTTRHVQFSAKFLIGSLLLVTVHLWVAFLDFSNTNHENNGAIAELFVLGKGGAVLLEPQKVSSKPTVMTPTLLVKQNTTWVADSRDASTRSDTDVSLITGSRPTGNMTKITQLKPILRSLLSNEPGKKAPPSPQLLSPACRPSWGSGHSLGSSSKNSSSASSPLIRRIYFAHTRKAGGTLLKQLLSRFCSRHKLTFVHKEGEAVELPKRNDTLYVVNLRHPVARAISHYQYEGRWSCRQLKRRTKQFKSIPTEENARTLERFIDRDPYFQDRREKPCAAQQGRRGWRDVPRLWICAKSCYLRWYGANFNCLEDKNDTTNSLTESYRTALENLSQFHLIVVTEWLTNPTYWHGLTTRMFGLSNSTTDYNQNPWCDKEAKYWNQKYPAVLQNQTLEHLHQLNQWDIKLYENLTNCHPNNIVFPELPTYITKKRRSPRRHHDIKGH
ncbi:hypothetical protein ACA910_007852 [Epithemia clementina (nom. ined.)]